MLSLRSSLPTGADDARRFRWEPFSTCTRSAFRAGGIGMLGWALFFLVIGLIAGGLGFWRLEGTAMYIAEVLAVVFVVLFLVSLVVGRGRRLR